MFCGKRERVMRSLFSCAVAVEIAAVAKLKPHENQIYLNIFSLHTQTKDRNGLSITVCLKGGKTNISFILLLYHIFRTMSSAFLNSSSVKSAR